MPEDRRTALRLLFPFVRRDFRNFAYAASYGEKIYPYSPPTSELLMDFGAIEDAAGLVFIFIVFGVPALAIGARLALRPIVDAIVRLRESFASPPGLPVDSRVSALEAEVRVLRQEVRRLQESEEFARQLGSAASSRMLPESGNPL
jgi:hypothetical protein